MLLFGSVSDVSECVGDDDLAVDVCSVDASSVRSGVSYVSGDSSCGHCQSIVILLFFSILFTRSGNAAYFRPCAIVLFCGCIQIAKRGW